MSVHDSTSKRYITPQPSDAWTADAATQGKVGSQSLLGVDHTPAGPDAGAALNLAHDAQVVLRRRLMLADDQPVELAYSYYPAALADGTPIAENKKIKGGALRVLTETGHGIDHVAEQITARRPDTDEARLLDVPGDEPLIVLSRISYDAADEPVEYAVNRMVASRTAPLSYQIRSSEP